MSPYRGRFTADARLAKGCGLRVGVILLDHAEDPGDYFTRTVVDRPCTCNFCGVKFPTPVIPANRWDGWAQCPACGAYFVLVVDCPCAAFHHEDPGCRHTHVIFCHAHFRMVCSGCGQRRS